jgi:hypothetical protein
MPVITVDFAGLKSGGGGVNPRVPAGDYGVKCTKVVLKTSDKSKQKYLDISFKLIKGNKKGLGQVLHHSCSLQTQSLWNLRDMLEAMGKEIPAKAIKISTERLVGYTCASSVTDDEYEGRKKSRIASFFPLADLGKTSDNADDLDTEEEPEEEEEEEEIPKKKKKKPVEEEEPEEEEEEEEPAPKKKKKPRPVVSDDEEEDEGEIPEPPKKKKKVVKEEEEEEPEEEEEEEEPAPKKKKKKKPVLEEEEEEEAEELFS